MRNIMPFGKGIKVVYELPDAALETRLLEFESKVRRDGWKIYYTRRDEKLTMYVYDYADLQLMRQELDRFNPRYKTKSF